LPIADREFGEQVTQGLRIEQGLDHTAPGFKQAPGAVGEIVGHAMRISSAATVNNRLHAASSQLKQRILTTMAETLARRKRLRRRGRLGGRVAQGPSPPPRP
jgi:hypothetical protein